MPQAVRIGNAHGFWGDRLEAAAEMLALEPELDYLTLDFLAEVSMAILASQRERGERIGYARDFVDIVTSLVPYWRSGGKCRVITNAGGLDPVACGRACQEALERAGCPERKIAIVTGDDVLGRLQEMATAGADAELTRNLDTGAPVSTVSDRLITANAYLGAQSIAAALAEGADLVITGRVADPSLTVGPCVHHFGWNWNDWDRLAGATVAGHLIECGTQVTGGIFTDWLNVPNVDRIGFPIAEIAADGSCIVTKPRGSGGCVTESTVKEQLLYEIGDPAAYLSPDVTVSFLSLSVAEESLDRVRVSRAKGRPAPDHLKVGATYRNGFRASGQLTVIGTNATRKAQRAADVVLKQLEAAGIEFRETLVELIGGTDDALETLLRISVADDSRESLDRFARALMPLITAGPPGITGYAEGRPKVRPLIDFWPCLIRRELVPYALHFLTAGTGSQSAESSIPFREPMKPRPSEPVAAFEAKRSLTLADIALARSGDKGRHANIGVIAREPSDFERLRQELTTARVAEFLDIAEADRVRRYELPNLGALNFIIHDILDSRLRLDSQGKALGQRLLQMPLSNPS
ncbi:MAG: acyclic terpene utilization AtuA family protein [Pirellulales bacterium]